MLMKYGVAFGDHDDPELLGKTDFITSGL